MNDELQLPAEIGEPARVRLGRRLIGLGLVVVVIASVAAWFLTRETLPPVIRVATAAPGGLYHKLGELLEPQLEQQARRPVRIVETEGSVENQQLLRSGRAEVALLQGGAGNLDDLAAVAPLYYDVLHLIVRRGAGHRSLFDLLGKKIAVGSPRSGMLASALDLIRHYEVEGFVLEQEHFTSLRENAELEAAIVTTGLLNPDLDDLLETGDFELLPLRNADALALLHPYFETFTIPRGLFSVWPVIPSEDVQTITTTSFLAVREDAPDVLVRTLLGALYANDLRGEIPTMIRRDEAARWNSLPLHPAAGSFFQPYGGLDVLANFMESLAALKELLFALGAGLYLAWMRWQRLKEKEHQAVVQAGKDRLDIFLEKTIEIEQQMLEVHHQAALRSALREVTALKLDALRELTHESLRGDVNFSIFLQQCGDVIRRIQNKLQLVRQGVSFEVADENDDDLE